MIDKLMAELLEDITDRLLKDRECIELLMEKHLEALDLIDKMANAFIALQANFEILNKSMLNFIPEKDRKGNQIVQ